MLRVILAHISMLLCVTVARGQCFFVESFDFEVDSHWLGDLDAFEIRDGQLTSSSKEAHSMFELYRVCSSFQESMYSIHYALDMETSSLNYLELFIRDRQLEIVYQVGGKSDALSLLKRDSKGEQLIEQMAHGHTSKEQFDTRIVLRNDSLYVNTYLYDYDTVFISNRVPVQFSDSVQIGFRVQQSTASFFGKVSIAEVDLGPKEPDSQPPSVNSISVSPGSVYLQFDEAVMPKRKMKMAIGSSASPLMNWVSDTAVFMHDLNIHPGVTSLTIDQLCDRWNNCRNLDSFFLFTPPPRLSAHDIIISEIMPNPIPHVKLPESEFIELCNRTDSAINLTEWTISDPTRKAELTGCTIGPNQRLILCNHNDTIEFKQYGPTCGITGIPSLNNSGDSLTLSDPVNNEIHTLTYMVSDLPNSWKSEGGWSMEMIDPSQPCISGNWSWSVSSTGGTPGVLNSIDERLIDDQAPRLLSVISADQMVSLVFDEQVELINEDYYLTQPRVYEAYVERNKAIILHTRLELDSSFELKLGKLADCIGNEIRDTSIRVGKPGELTSNELILNEVLYHPFGHIPEFIEVRNIGQGIEDLSRISLALLDDDGLILRTKPISNERLVIYPGETIALSAESEPLFNSYPGCVNQRIHEIDGWLSLNNSGGRLALTLRNGDIIDSLTYGDHLHFGKTQDHTGISLERRSTSNNSIWSSASRSIMATPGCPNSWDFSSNKSLGKVGPDPFSPNSDGFQDVVFIQSEGPHQLVNCSVNIYNQAGFLIAKPYINLTLYQDETLIWDGLTADGLVAPNGIYIIEFIAVTEASKKVWYAPVTVWQ